MNKRMRRSLIVGIFCLVSLPLVGCVTAGRGDKMEADIAALQTEMEALKSSISKDREKLNETLIKAQQDVERLESVLQEARNVLGRNSADLSADLEALRKAVDRLSGSLDVSKREFQQLQKAFELFQKDVDGRLNSHLSLPKDPDGLWEVGNQRFNDEKHDDARKAFEKFAQEFPQHDRADDALVLLGQTFLKQERYQDAARTFTRVLREYKDSDVNDAANFGFGNALVGLGRCDDARVFFEEVTRMRRSPYRKEATAKVRAIKRGKLCK